MPIAKVPLRAGHTEARCSFRRAVVLAVACFTFGPAVFAQDSSVREFPPTREARAAVRTAEFHGDPLRFEDRVLYQRRIEEVYWRHRIWPAENPASKPSLAAVLSDDALRERVATYLEKSVALELTWSRPVTGEQLQAEMNRMVRDSKNPGLLRELFAVLDDDPLLVAECLARPVLVDRLTRNWYASDARFHEALRKQAETALAAHRHEAGRMTDLGGEYVETEWRLAPRGLEAAHIDSYRAERSVVHMNVEEWRKHLERLAALLGIEREPEETDTASTLLDRIPVGQISRLTEENDRFVIASVLSREPDRLRVATVTWNKRLFDTWWAQEGRAVVEAKGNSTLVSPPTGGYKLASSFDGACTADTWTELWYLAKARRYHSAIWTGTEMIVWGGDDGARELNTGGRYNPATDSWTPTSKTVGVPTARRYPTAVWTGTEMIVWGGLGPGSLNTGGRYDPATDSWAATSTAAGVPTARRHHTAVWVGSEMIVWGGEETYQNYTNSGARYDPATDGWTPISTAAGVPTARRQHTAVQVGKEMIVWGGFDGGYVNTGGRYDPTTDSWTPTSTGAGAPTGRFSHTAVQTGTEMIVWGGRDGVGELNTGGQYDPTTNSWTATATQDGAPTARHNHSAIWTGTEMIVWGGYDVEYTSTGGRYDPATNSWTATATDAGAPQERWLHTAVWTGTEMIVWGGYGYGELNSGGRYDPATDSWTPTATDAGVPAARFHHTAVWTGTEMVVWGGRYYLGTPLNTGGRYDPATDVWTPTSTEAGVPDGRWLHTALWTGTEMVVWGGEYLDCGKGHDRTDRYFSTGGRYDPLIDAWTATSMAADLPTERSSHTAVWTGTEMIVWGGVDQDGPLNDGAMYDPATDAWSATAGTAPEGRHSHTAVWTGAEMIVWGGIGSGDEYLNSGGRYDRATGDWSETWAGTGAPSGRHEHTAVWSGREMIVWGGKESYWDPTNTGGRYDPATDGWTPTSWTHDDVPEAKGAHTAVWTGREMIVWGGDGDDFFNDGGRYTPDEDGWTPTSTAPGVPTERASHTAVWTGTMMVVWGGEFGAEYWDLNTGGLYCACVGETVTTWFPDADGDGYGADSTGIPSCSQPPGYIAVGGDCDDRVAETFPGAPETNDGLDNQCPGDSGHGLVDEISGVCGFHNPVNANEFSCPLQAGAPRYEVARSPHPEFPDWVGCLRIVSSTATWVDSDPVPEGTCFYYLVRSHEPNMGSWGANSGGIERTVTCHR